MTHSRIAAIRSQIFASFLYKVLQHNLSLLLYLFVYYVCIYVLAAIYTYIGSHSLLFFINYVNNEHHDYILSVLLKQAKAGSSWFLEIAFVWEVDMRVCLCVSAPELLKTIRVK